MKQKYIVRLRHEWESFQTVQVQAENKEEAVEFALLNADAAASHDEAVSYTHLTLPTQA